MDLDMVDRFISTKFGSNQLRSVFREYAFNGRASRKLIDLLIRPSREKTLYMPHRTANSIWHEKLKEIGQRLFVLRLWCQILPIKIMKNYKIQNKVKSLFTHKYA